MMEGSIYRFVDDKKRDLFVKKSGATASIRDDVSTRIYLAERGACYAGKSKIAWKKVTTDMQVLDESNAWRVRRQGETTKVWKDRVKKKQAFLKS